MTKNQFLDAPKLPGVVVHDEPIDPSAPEMVRGEKKRHYLELPRGITLKRFVNTRRETHFIGQYNNSENPCNVNPRRIYTIDVVPLAPADLMALGVKLVWEVAGREDDKLLFKITTQRGRSVAEYLGVKALKAWLNYCGSQRRGKKSRKLHAKRNKRQKKGE